MYACLLELRVGQVAGFDLSALNAYWWYPGPERLALARLPHRRLSAPFPVRCLDLQARLDAALARRAAKLGTAGADASAGAGSASVPASAAGSEDGAEHDGDGGDDGTSGSGGAAAAEPDWELDSELEVPVTADGQWNAVAFWFELHAGHGSGAVVTSWGDGRGADGAAAAAAGADEGDEAAGGGTDAAASEQPAAAASSWDQAVQYVDSQAVAAGGSVRLRVRQDGGQLVFTTAPPQCRPRHALGELWRGWDGTEGVRARLGIPPCLLSPTPAPCAPPRLPANALLCSHPTPPASPALAL